jgi:plasmid stabilization system protein ParE
MTCKKRIAPAAHRDIEGIRNYIAKDKQSAADKVANGIYDAFDFLAENPHIGGSLKERYGIVTDFLFWVVAPYIIFYKLEDEFVGIYRVLDGRSDYLVTMGLKPKKK